MKLMLAEICKYGECTIASKNFVEGEKLLNADYLLKCGTLTTHNDNGYDIVAYCRQVASANEKPHEIRGNINIDGSVTSFTCSCEAGSSGKCIHVLAVLLFCSRNDVDKLADFSSTDTKCAWANSGTPNPSELNSKITLEPVTATPICEIKCYKDSYKGVNSIALTETQRNNLQKMINSFNPGQSSLS
ncbi:uncharacterized protein LOC106637964 [Copidosoma floridanum]|uniref:uncharacterized protein LOC106637964 n=1 Tax=Copidosoma floridanum TaxID=29053 RepID=UPI0006C9B8C0|nr:uncharacterized protein LOC106637964 [Copidosoma floridanum]